MGWGREANFPNFHFHHYAYILNFFLWNLSDYPQRTVGPARKLLFDYYADDLQGPDFAINQG